MEQMAQWACLMQGMRCEALGCSTFSGDGNKGAMQRTTPRCPVVGDRLTSAMPRARSFEKSESNYYLKSARGVLLSPVRCGGIPDFHE